MMKVLITGGAGFVGSNLANTLASKKESYLVDIIDDFSVGRRDNLDSENINVLEGDILTYDFADKTYDAIVHCAVKDIKTVGKDVDSGVRVNIGGTLRMLDLAKKLNSKFIYISSASVYGNTRNAMLTEGDPTEPMSFYGMTKLAGENLSSLYYQLHGVKTVCLRLFNVYGKNQRPDNAYCQVISTFINQATNNQPLTVWGDGEQTRDFTDVRDIVEAITYALDGDTGTGGVFNVSTGIEISMNKLAELILKKIHPDKSPEENISLSPIRHMDDVRRRCGNVEKMRQIFRWYPKVSLSTGLNDTIKWLKELTTAS